MKKVSVLATFRTYGITPQVAILVKNYLL